MGAVRTHGQGQEAAGEGGSGSQPVERGVAVGSAGGRRMACAVCRCVRGAGEGEGEVVAAAAADGGNDDGNGDGRGAAGMDGESAASGRERTRAGQAVTASEEF